MQLGKHFVVSQDMFVEKFRNTFIDFEIFLDIKLYWLKFQVFFVN